MEIALKIIELVFTLILVPALLVVGRLIVKVSALEERLSKGDLPDHWKANIKVIVEEVLNRSDRHVTDRMERLEKQILDVSQKQFEFSQSLHKVRAHLRIYDEEK